MALAEPDQSTPLLAMSTSSSSSSDDSETSSPPPRAPSQPSCGGAYKSLAVLYDHAGGVACLALCGEFMLSASHGRDIIVWQQPDLRRFTRFGHGDGSVKALVTVGSRVFTAHQDSVIRVWKVSRSSENVFRLAATLPTAKDYLGKFMKQSNYVQTRRHHHRLWIEHADSISCLAVTDGVVYSGSWDRTLKVWRLSDLKCLESIRAHDDAINALAASSNGLLYSASADGKIKIWRRKEMKSISHSLVKVLENHCSEDVAWNAIVLHEGGGFVYGGRSDGRVLGWKADATVDDWWLVSNVQAHEMSVLCLCPMGEELLCSGSADRTIAVWQRGKDDGDLDKMLVIRGHEGPVKCLQASNACVGGGFMLYSGGLDKSLRVWWVPASAGIEKKAGAEEKKIVLTGK